MEQYTEKQRIIQELVPGKQITLAHIIANPDEILYDSLLVCVILHCIHLLIHRSDR